MLELTAVAAVALRQGARRWSCGLGHLLPLTPPVSNDGEQAEQPDLCGYTFIIRIGVISYSHPQRVRRGSGGHRIFPILPAPLWISDPSTRIIHPSGPHRNHRRSSTTGKQMRFFQTVVGRLKNRFPSSARMFRQSAFVEIFFSPI